MTVPVKKLVDDNGDQFTDQANLVTSFQTTPDDTHYPSEKLVYDKLIKKELVSGVTIPTVSDLTISDLTVRRKGNRASVVFKFTNTAPINSATILENLPKATFGQFHYGYNFAATSGYRLNISNAAIVMTLEIIGSVTDEWVILSYDTE